MLCGTTGHGLVRVTRAGTSDEGWYECSVVRQDEGWYECSVVFLQRTDDSNPNGTWVYLAVTGQSPIGT